VDPVTGTLAKQQIGNELVECGENFAFSGALFPAKITYSGDGVRIDVRQTMVELKDPPEIVLAPTANASVRPAGKTFKRAIGQSMPQPPEGRGGRDADVEIRGIIREDGRVHQAAIQSAERPDLGQEALALVQQWVFAPNTEEDTFVVHFHGR